MSVRHLEFLFHPKSIAVIGASDRLHSMGALLMRNLKQDGFEGPVWPVNRRHARVADMRAYRTVSQLPAVPDLALICTPPATVPGIVAELGRLGTHAAVVLVPGMKARPKPSAPTYEQQMLDAARPHILRILGPEGIGLLVPGARLNASSAHVSALPGALAFVSQSGAVATAMLDWAHSRGIGFTHFVSLGNDADVDFADMLDYLASDSATRAILVYVESIQDARKSMSAARAAARNKPVIVVKAGRGSEGAKVTITAGGVTVGTDTVFDAAIRRAGMLRVNSLADLFDAAETLARVRGLEGARLAIFGNGGGAGMLAADALALGRGKLAPLSSSTLTQLGQVLPANWSHGNPVDILGDAPAARYLAAFEVLQHASEVDAVLFMHAPSATVPSQDIAQALIPAFATAAKPVLGCWMGGQAVAQARQRCAEAGIPTYDTPERAVTAFLQIMEYRANQAALLEAPAAVADDFVPDVAGAQTLIQQILAHGGSELDASQVRTLFSLYGIAMAESPAARRVHAHELMAGMTVDPVVGPVLVFGQGGSAAEVIADFEVALPPLNRVLTRQLVARTRVARLLAGYRDRPAIDHEALHQTLVRISQLVCDLPEVVALDINPLLVDENGVIALEGRVRIERATTTGAARLAIRPYPSALEQRIVHHGEPLLIRPIRPEDSELLQAFYATSHPRDMRLRFFMARREVPHSELARYTQIDYDREMTFVALGTDAAGQPSLWGEVRAVSDPNNVRAEFAVQVRSDHQQKGLGRVLLEKMIAYLRSRGTRLLAGECLLENEGMRRLALTLGFEVKPSNWGYSLMLPLQPTQKGSLRVR